MVKALCIFSIHKRFQIYFCQYWYLSKKKYYQGVVKFAYSSSLLSAYYKIINVEYEGWEQNTWVLRSTPVIQGLLKASLISLRFVKQKNPLPLAFNRFFDGSIVQLPYHFLRTFIFVVGNRWAARVKVINDHTCMK